MTILAEIKLLIAQCAQIAKDGSLPIISDHDADRYIEHLNQFKSAYQFMGRCPVCGSDQTEGEAVDIEGGTATQECHCLQCNATWLSTYTLRETTITWSISPEQST